MLTKAELQQLRNQIVLNSLYINDYENDMGFDPKDVCSFFEGYVDYLSEGISDRGIKNPNDYIDALLAHDTIDNLYNWYLCFTTEPLVKKY